MSIPREGSKPRISPLLTVLQQRTSTSPAGADENSFASQAEDVTDDDMSKVHPTWRDDVGPTVQRFNETWRFWMSSAEKGLKGRGLLASFLAMVVVPAIFALIYFGLIASNQYVTEVKFALRSMDRSNSHATLGAMTGVPSAVTGVADSFILADFMTTRQLVDELEAKVGLRKMLSHSSADFLSRLNPSASIEEVVDHWRSTVSSRYELSTGILSVQVRAFTPQDSLKLAEALIVSAERVANELTGNGRQGLVGTSEADMKKAEQRLQSANQALADFKPAAASEPGSEVTAQGAVKRISLEKEQALAERDYANAVTALRSAQALADRQQMYLATFAKPALPESSRFPNRLGSIGLVTGMAFLAWIVTLLIVLGVRDHMR